MTDASDLREEYRSLKQRLAALLREQRTHQFRAKGLEVEIGNLRHDLSVLDEIIREKVAEGRLSRGSVGDDVYFGVASRCGYF